MIISFVCFSYELLQYPYCSVTLCYVATKELLNYTHLLPEGVDGTARVVSEMCQPDRDIDRTIGRLGWESFGGCGSTIVAASMAGSACRA